eukprot:SAG31_NODE_4146_length_3533_cov_2.126674_3_plen_61_part_00
MRARTKFKFSNTKFNTLIHVVPGSEWYARDPCSRADRFKFIVRVHGTRSKGLYFLYAIYL